MASRQLLFRILYGIGFTPWDGHPQSAMVRELVEGTDRQPPGSALDVGCGTGNTSIYLVQYGWTLLSAADERIVPQCTLAGKFPARLEARSYLLQRNA